MSRQPAKVLEPGDVRRVLRQVAESRHPARNRAMFLLSLKAGLRACEISGLEWPMLLTAKGTLSASLTVTRIIAKRGSARGVPIHPQLAEALLELHAVQGCPRRGPIITSERGGRMTARSVVNWFRETYAAAGLHGCSSHSGRRTFITRSARMLERVGGSLRDVQELAGHRALTTTERYIAGNRDAQRRIIKLI